MTRDLQHQTIPGMFRSQAAALAGKTLFLAKRDGAYQPMTWQAAAADVDALAAFLLRRQIKPKDRVLLLAENRPEWGMADLAIQSVGA